MARARPIATTAAPTAEYIVSLCAVLFRIASPHLLRSIAEDVLEFCDDAMDSAQYKFTEIQKLLADVIPSFLTMSRKTTSVLY